MAESSSSPSSYELRSTHKLLEYTSSINTTLPSPTNLSTFGNFVTHSSFDDISQPRDCDTLVMLNQQTVKEIEPNGQQQQQQPNHLPTLERDLRRIDLHDRYVNNLLDRNQSISLPTPPPEQLPYHHPILIVPDDDNDDELQFSLGTSTDYMIVPKERNSMNQDDNEQIEQQIPMRKSVLQAVSSTSSSSSTSSIEPSTSVSYGVDWSEHAQPTSHCWFPYTPSDPSTAHPCAYLSCTNPKPLVIVPLVQCESCTLVVHNHHLIGFQTTIAHGIPLCRPSFSDASSSNKGEDCNNKFDRHYWSRVPILSKPCVLCKRKSMSTTLFGSGTGRPSTMSALESPTQSSKSGMNSLPVNSSPTMSGSSSNNLICLWCSRGYHQRCLDRVSNEDEKNKCDYGIFRNIIVRPQWLSRVPHSSNRFRAKFPSKSHQSDETTNSSYTPLLLFINKRSGGQSGEKIYRKLLRLLNPRQVFLLENDATIIHAIDIYASLPNTRICVFGGDGTVGWVLGRLAETYPLLNNPPVSICPLGTGNDLSRVLAWGEQYDPKRLLSTLIQIPQAQAIALDRWQVNLEQLDLSTTSSRSPSKSSSTFGRTFLPLINHPKFIRDTNRASYQNHRTLPNTRFINYMSFGLDAAIALEFHDRRTRDPSKFSSPWKNKLMYLNESRKYLNDFARSKMWNLGSYIRLICDGENFTDSIRNCHTLLVLNIPGYASGTNPWGKTSTINTTNNHSQSTIQKDGDSLDRISTSSVEIFDSPANAHEVYELVTLNDCGTEQSMTPSIATVTSGRFDRQDFGDRKIEVVGLSTTHMATIHIGFRGIRIAQCNHLRIELCCPMTAQMDGEPFYLPASVAVNITHAGQMLVLRNENR